MTTYQYLLKLPSFSSLTSLFAVLNNSISTASSTHISPPSPVPGELSHSQQGEPDDDEEQSIEELSDCTPSSSDDSTPGAPGSDLISSSSDDECYAASAIAGERVYH